MKHPARRYLFASALSLLIAGAAWAIIHHRSQAARPNIVLIVWDTCRADRTQVNGCAMATTPNLLRLAAEGETFRQCFSPSPWTPPSHASLFTGLLPRHHGLREGVGDRPNPGIPLLAETLRDAGYETVAVVANPQISGVTGLDAGFDRAIQCFESKVPGARGMNVETRVLEWLDERSRGGGGGPFFLFVNLMESHIPYSFDPAEVAALRGPEAVAGAREAAERVSEMVVGDHTLGIRRVEPALFPHLNAAYDGAVRMADRATGKILDRLRADGLLDPSLVVVCGDHGENLGEHGALGHVQSLSEQVLHVPLVVRWPGRSLAGAVEDGQVRLQDVYPTILEAAGVAVPPGCGRDALPLSEKPLRSRLSVSEFGPTTGSIPAVLNIHPDAPPEALEPLYRALFAVREPSDRPGARKFLSVVRTTVGGPPKGVREELFDLVADPGEDRDLLSGASGPGEKAAADRLRALGGR